MFHSDAERLLNKVPEVTLAYWVIKIMSTTVGETGADYLAVHGSRVYQIDAHSACQTRCFLMAPKVNKILVANVITLFRAGKLAT